jgi:hypothetical protein
MAGHVMTAVSQSAPLFIGGTMKIAYDILLWFALRHAPPPEEIS